MQSAKKRLASLGLIMGLAGGLVACGDAATDQDISGIGKKDPPGIGDEPGYGFTPGAGLTLQSAGWQWVDLEGARCQDGSNTGFFVQKGSVNRLVVYFEGGGACFNRETCLSNPQVFDEAGGTRRRDAVTVMNDATEGNPFQNWNKVFLGYCSGDIYSGIRDKQDGFEGRTQQGFVNVGLMLERVVPTFTEIDDVVLTGSSAGGFGALFNWLRVQEAFGAKEVTLVNDSGPPLSSTYVPPCFQKISAETWGWDKTLPPGCKDCDKTIASILPYYVSSFPGHRFSLMSYTQDSTIRLFFGFGLDNCMPEVPNIPAMDFATAIDELRDNMSVYPNFALWTAAGTSHTFLIGGDLGLEVEGVKMSEWLEDAIDGGEYFRNVGP